MTGAEILLQALRREGVDTVFGYPGGVVLKIYDAFFDEQEIQHYLVRHEQAAVHMADGYARSTGKVGVALVTSGPAATNTVTGLATANLDSIPIVVITGQVPTQLIGNDAFQEVDIVGITRPCTKHNYLVQDIRDLPRIIKEAFAVAATGRPGPVLVDLPKNVSVGDIDPEELVWPEEPAFRGYHPVTHGHPAQVKRLADALLASSRPVFYVGGGAILANASDELCPLIEQLNVPITQTLMGLGTYPMDGPASLGMLGMHGTYTANMAVQQSDLLVSIGARFDDRVTGNLEHFAPNAEIAHIDVDPASISKNVDVSIPIVGDVREVMGQLRKALQGREQEVEQLQMRQDPWWAQIREWQQRHPLTYEPSSDSEIKPQHVIELLAELTGGDAIVSADVGQHQMWVAQFFPFREPRTWLNSGGLGTMGYGFPAAVGAKVAHPNKTVISVNGDGGILMNIQEVATCVQYDIPVVVVVINNFYLGMVRQWQQIFFNRRYSQSEMFAMPDFVQLAKSFGAEGMTIRDIEALRPGLEKALAANKPVFVDVHVAREENVYPMVPAGAALDEMLLA